MFEKPPPGKEWVSWLYVGLWSLGIFALIPFARAISELVSNRWGRVSFFYLALAAIAVAGGLAVRQLARRRLPLTSYLWLAGIGAIFVVYTYRLRQAPEEALHFAQYGVLGVLGYRALSHRVRDWTIYPTAAILGAVVGVLDEMIQWVTPGRFWGLQDIWIDFLGAALAVLGIARGLRPAIISGPAGRTGVRWLCHTGVGLVVVLGATLLNTPERIAWYSQRIPGLAFLRTNESVMFEYGHRYVDPETGPFRSRFAPAELRRVDRERGAEVARILDRFRDHSRYREFLETYTPVSDPFVHEARVHLFRRDRHMEWAADVETALYEPRAHYAVAFRENRIMEKYFPNTLSHSSYVLAREQVALLRQSRMSDEELPAREVESRVGRRLVTALSEIQVGGLLLLAALALAIVGWRYGEERPIGGRS